MVWILETMRAEEPHLCNPFAICWKTNHRDMKPSAALNVYEEGIENLRRWFYFEVKPNSCLYAEMEHYIIITFSFPLLI